MKIYEDINLLIDDLCEKAKLSKGDIFVIGCSTSEILGKKIGSFSSEEIGREVFEASYKNLTERGIFLAGQACEHLNRALVVERELAERERLEIVTVVPKVNAGGAFASACYQGMKDPVVVEYIKADAGIDIGNTMIGMHIKHVAVPVRLFKNKLESANIVAAKSRPKLIGGSRARYD